MLFSTNNNLITFVKFNNNQNISDITHIITFYYLVDSNSKLINNTVKICLIGANSTEKR